MKSVITISMCLVMTLVLNFVFGGIAYADLNDGLVAYYPFDGDANDESGNGNHGTVLGPTLITDMCGKEDGAYSFGELKHIKINHNEKINFGSGDVFTISAFVKPEKGDTYLCNENGQSCTHYGAIVVKSPISGFYNYGLYYDRKYKKFMGGYHYMHHAVYGADGVDEDKWYHLVLIYQNCSWKLYVNTDLVDTSSNHCITTSQGALEIGRKGDSNNNTDFFRGIIDDIRIYNRVLSETEIKELSDGKCNTECNEEDSGSIDITGKSGPCGGKQTIPVRIQDAPATANSIGFDVAFDSGVLIYTGFARGELAESFDFFNVTEISDGLVRCGGFKTEELAEGSVGDLLYLQFDVTAKCYDSKLELRELKDDISTWTASHGCFSMKCTGDVNNDGEITPKDALCVFEKYLEICPTSCGIPCDEVCGDVTADGECTPADGLCIFRKYLEIPGCLDQ